MPTVLIAPEAFLHQPEASYARVLTDAGFDIRYPKNPTFTRGLGPEEETIAELKTARDHRWRRVLHAASLGCLPEATSHRASWRRLRPSQRPGCGRTQDRGHDYTDLEPRSGRRVDARVAARRDEERRTQRPHAAIRRLVAKLTAPIRGRTVGLIGLGRIGKSTAVRCARTRHASHRSRTIP